MRFAACSACLVLTSLLGACAPLLPAQETAEADVLKAWGTPTARYALPGGGQRLEYATGPSGRQTWMIDISAAGRTSGARQVLSDTAFMDIQQRPGLRAEEVLLELGSPGERRGARGGGQTWTWRYPTNDCLWFQVTIDTDIDKVRAAGYGIDPRCDAATGDRN